MYGGQTDGNSGKREHTHTHTHIAKHTNTQRHTSPASHPASIGQQQLSVQLWKSHVTASFTVTICPQSSTRSPHNFLRLHARQLQPFSLIWSRSATRNLTFECNRKLMKCPWLQTMCWIVRKNCFILFDFWFKSSLNQYLSWASSFLQRDYLHWPRTRENLNF